MVGPAEIVSVIGAISALARLLTIRNESRQKGKEPTSEEVDRVLRQMPKEPGAESSAMIARVISQDILEVIRDNIEKAKQRFVDALKDPANTQQDIDKEYNVAKSTICAELSRIRTLNLGRLPPDLELMWSQFQCG